METLRRRFAVGIIAVAAILAVAVRPAAGADNQGLRFRSVDTSRFPKVGLTVFLNRPATGPPLKAGDVRLTENGARQQIFELEPIGGRPMFVVLAIDTSGSMSGDPLAKAKIAAKDFIASLQPKHTLAIISFNDSPAVVASPSGNKILLANAADSLAASTGDTALFDSLAMSLDLCAKAGTAQKNIVVLSDGADNRSTQLPDNVLKRAADMGVAIFGVGLVSSDFDRQTLDRITAGTGGRLVTTSDPQTLSALYQSLAKELSQQYAISYISSGRAKTKDLNIQIATGAGAGKLTGGKSVPNPRFDARAGAVAAAKNAVPSAGAATRIVSTPWFYYLVLAMFFLTVAGGSAAVMSLAARTKDPLPAALNQYGDLTVRKPAPSKAEQRKVMRAAIEMTGQLAEKRGLVETIQLLLLRAGVPLRPAEFIFFHFTAVAAAALATLWLTDSVLAAVLVGAAFVTTPLFYLNYLINKRKTEFHNQLPDLLMMVSGSLKAGHSLSQALRVAADEMSPPASLELNKVLAEINLGLPVEEALDSMALRIGSENLTWTVTAIKIHLQVGGNLADLLDNLAATVRERDMVARQIKGLTAEGRLSAGILFALPFILASVIYIINRPYVALLFQTTAGAAMIVAALLMMGIGALWLKSIVTIEV